MIRYIVRSQHPAWTFLKSGGSNEHLSEKQKKPWPEKRVECGMDYIRRDHMRVGSDSIHKTQHHQATRRSCSGMSGDDGGAVACDDAR